MIPPVVMYVLGVVLALFGLYRISLGRRPDAKSRKMHLVFGVLYVLMGLFLILTTAGVIPAPRFGAPKRKAPAPVPVYPIPRPPASQPASQPGK